MTPLEALDILATSSTLRATTEYNEAERILRELVDAARELATDDRLLGHPPADRLAALFNAVRS